SINAVDGTFNTAVAPVKIGGYISQPSHHRLPSRYVPSAAAVRPETAAQSSFSVEAGRSGCYFGRGVPGRSGKPPTQWRPQPEPPFDGHPVVFSLRFAGSAGAQRNHPTRAGDSEPTTAARASRLSDPTRDRGPPSGAESNQVVGTPRPRLSD